MARGPDATEKEVYGGVGGDEGFVVGAFGREVGSHAVKYVHVLCGDVDVLEEVRVHEGVVGLGVGLGKGDVFVLGACISVLEEKTEGDARGIATLSRKRPFA